MTINQVLCRLALASSLAGLTLTAAQPASAFEAIYGAPAASESGAQGVAPVQFCAGGGFISVGTRVLGASSDVYVLRTTAAGAVLFERFYNINAGAADRGNSIVELSSGGGFVIAGVTTSPGATDDALLLRIDCSGNPIWTFAYGDTIRKEVANDIIEAQTGNAAVGTAPGDLVVAGTTTNPAGDTEALLFRVRTNGALLWNRRHDVGASSGSLVALTEARPSIPGSPTGDIVAVGAFRGAAGGADQGYVIRASGDTGIVGGGNTCSAIYGGPDVDRFTGVFESRIGPTAGQLYFTGSSFSGVQANDIYLVRAQPNPCFSIAQRRIGGLATSALGDETPADIRQKTAASGIGPLGGIILTGSIGTSTTTAYDAFLLSADINTLAPFVGRRYGAPGNRRDSGSSLFQLPVGLPAGFIIAGTSASDFQAVGDPLDLYFIRTDVNGNTTCNLPWAPPHVTVNFPPTALQSNPIIYLPQVARPVAVGAQNQVFVRCP